MHNNVRYNCRVFILNRQIVLIRPKIYLADDGNYREKRFFASWDRNDSATLYDHVLSDALREATYPCMYILIEEIETGTTMHSVTLVYTSSSSIVAQEVAPIGIGIIRTQETLLASEICEELWTANSPHIQLYLSGIDHPCSIYLDRS